MIKIEKFKVLYVDNKVDIVNFTKIVGIDSDKMILENKDKTCLISGKDLVVSKLLVDEVLISGEINKIEFR